MTKPTVGDITPRQVVLGCIKCRLSKPGSRGPPSMASAPVPSSRFCLCSRRDCPQRGVRHGSVRWNTPVLSELGLVTSLSQQWKATQHSVCVCACHKVCVEVTACESLFFLPQRMSPRDELRLLELVATAFICLTTFPAPNNVILILFKIQTWIQGFPPY